MKTKTRTVSIVDLESRLKFGVGIGLDPVKMIDSAREDGLISRRVACDLRDRMVVFRAGCRVKSVATGWLGTVTCDVWLGEHTAELEWDHDDDIPWEDEFPVSHLVGVS